MNTSKVKETGVKLYNKKIVLPTYRIGKPDRNPVFSMGMMYNLIYPFTLQDKLTDHKHNKAYNFVILENEYIKVFILPELGGRIHGARDKTNGYDFLYYQHQVKPGLVSFTGAWLSGGIEWNFPIGHRASGFRPIDSWTQENPDGSKTVWVGETDLVSRMRWIVGTTVFPGKTTIETTGRLINTTSHLGSFWWWATAAVHATPEYQIVMPGEIVSGHDKQNFQYFPVHKGVDCSYWKNLPYANSFFAWDGRHKDFYGGYSHDKKGGFMHWADHHYVPGKKLWTWGTAPSGRLWDRILTDIDGPYFEPQAGGFSDNQPDFHWLEPGEVKTLTHYWFPIRDIQGAKNANLDAVLNLEVKESGDVLVGLNTTKLCRSHRVVLKQKGVILLDEEVEISPAKPYVRELKVQKGSKAWDFRLALLDQKKREVIAYQPEAPHPQPALPTGTPALQPPEKVASVDELVTVGLNLEKFKEMQRAMPYYQEVLKRDPKDVRTNVALGRRKYWELCYKEMEQYMRTALERDRACGDAYFGLGLALEAQGKTLEALDQFYRATYELKVSGASFQKVAELETKLGNFSKALMMAKEAVLRNGRNTRAYILQAALLRRQGKMREALEAGQASAKVDPLDMLAPFMMDYTYTTMGDIPNAKIMWQRLQDVSRNDPFNFLEAAVFFIEAGLYEEAEILLKDHLTLLKKSEAYALIHYYMAYVQHRLGREEEAKQWLSRGKKASPEYVFPNRLMDGEVLQYALSVDAQDGSANYYLGNLFFAHTQQARAIKCWEKAAKKLRTFPVVHRNLGAAYRSAKKYQKAKQCYEQAIRCDSQDPRFHQELDMVMEESKAPRLARLKHLAKYKKVLNTWDPALSRYVKLCFECGEMDEAIYYLKSHHFHSWEGQYWIYDIYYESLRERAVVYQKKNKLSLALADLEAAVLYPENLEVAPALKDTHAHITFQMGEVYQAMANQAKAKECFEKIVKEDHPDESAGVYFQAKALDALGKPKQARIKYLSLIRWGTARAKKEEKLLRYLGQRNPFLINFPSHPAMGLYQQYLGWSGLGQNGKAQQALKKALKREPEVARAAVWEMRFLYVRRKWF